MTNPEIMEAMQTLSKGNVGKTATARIRNIFDGIKLAMNAGVKREAIWEAINKIEGYKMPLKTFESAIYRIRKEREGDKKQKAEESTKFQNALQESPSTLVTTLRPIGIAAEALETKVGAEKVTGCDEVVEAFNGKQNTSKYNAD